MMIRTPEGPVPDWKCERYRLGELDADEMEHIRLRAEWDEELKARLTELERSDRGILQRYPPGVMARRIEARLAAAGARAATVRVRRFPRLVWVPAAAAALFAGVVWWGSASMSGRRFSGAGGDDPAGVRAKGPAAVLSLYRRTAGGSERLENGALVSEHDLIGARAQSDGRTWGMIVSVDGRGVVTRHLPERDGEAAPLATGSHALDFAYELDDAPGWEIFLLASSSSGFAADAVLDALAASALCRQPGLSAAAAESTAHSLQLPDGVSISALTLIKEADDEP